MMPPTNLLNVQLLFVVRAGGRIESEKAMNAILAKELDRERARSIDLLEENIGLRTQLIEAQLRVKELEDARVRTNKNARES